MKFCPQCGTTFEPEARFCLECGFDRSSVEPLSSEPHTKSRVSDDEPSSAETTPNSPLSEPESKPLCPQCGTPLIPGDRFCGECGFDAATVTTNAPVVEEVPPEVETPVKQPPASTPETKQFCPQCGSVISTKERFCQECGFDTSTENTAGNTAVETPEQKSAAAEPVYSAPVIEQTPPAWAEPAPAPTPQFQQAKQSVPLNTPPVQAQGPLTKQKTKKSWILPLLVVLIVGALGAGGWFVYTKYFSSEEPEEAVMADTIATVPSPEVDDAPIAEPETVVTETPVQTTQEKPKTTAKPKSKIDEELAKYREKEKSKTTQPTTGTPQTNPNAGVKISAASGGSDIKLEVILEVGRKDEPKNKNPKNPVKLSIQNPTMIVRITTDHYNDGMGTSGGGSITLKDRNGNIMGTYKAKGKSGTKGAPNAIWVAEPYIQLEKGTYYIWDSDSPTWSKNLLGNGFIVVEGYEIK